MTHPIFSVAPHLGFDTGESAAEQSRFIFTRDQNKPVDWQPKRKERADEIPGSNRVLRQDMGMGAMTLTTGLVFASERDYMRFYLNHRKIGTLRMQRSASIWPGRERTFDGRAYVEFDNVTVSGSPSGITRDVFGAVHCTVTFEREDSVW